MANTISVRVSTKLKEDSHNFAKDEKLEQTSEAARKLLMFGLEEWHKKKALCLLSLGKITLSKAAELTGLSIWELSDLVKQNKTVWLKEKRFIEKDLAIKI